MSETERGNFFSGDEYENLGEEANGRSAVDSDYPNDYESKTEITTTTTLLG